jgi:hypothetical protein
MQDWEQYIEYYLEQLANEERTDDAFFSLIEIETEPTLIGAPSTSSKTSPTWLRLIAQAPVRKEAVAASFGPKLEEAISGAISARVTCPHLRQVHACA